MSIKAACTCGAKFKVRLELAGKSVRCPKCARAFAVPKAPTTPNSIHTTCECGRSVRTKRDLAGKRVKCPECGRVVQLPGPEPLSDFPGEQSSRDLGLSSHVPIQHKAETASQDGQFLQKQVARTGGFSVRVDGLVIEAPSTAAEALHSAFEQWAFNCRYRQVRRRDDGSTWSNGRWSIPVESGVELSLREDGNRVRMEVAPYVRGYWITHTVESRFFLLFGAIAARKHRKALVETLRAAVAGITIERRKLRVPGLTVWLLYLPTFALLACIGFLVPTRLLKEASDTAVTAAQMEIRDFQRSLDNYALDTRDFPSTQEGLQALITAPSGTDRNWDGPYLNIETVPKDPWGNAYQYSYPPQRGAHSSPDIWSWGPDEEDGTDDDISNWSFDANSESEEAGND